MIQLQRLEGFYWAAKLGGYARAARAFPYPITAPGVHQQVKRLEAELETRLVERSAKDRIRLTAAGQALFDFIAPFLEGLRTLERGLKSGTHGGTLRIHAASLHVHHLLPAWLRKLHRARPDIEVELTEVRRLDLAALRTGEADLLIDHVPRLPREAEAVEVATMRTFLVVPSDHPLAGRAAVRVRDLRGESFVAYSEDLDGRRLQLDALGGADVVPTRVHSADSAEAILAFVASGLGVSLIPWLDPNGPRLAGIRAFRLEDPASSFPVHAVRRRTRVPDPLVDAALGAWVSR